MGAHRTRDRGLARGYAAVVGGVLVALGLLGFIDNPIVGDPTTSNRILATGTTLNVVHLGTGFLALYIASGIDGEGRANAVIGLGLLYVVILILTLHSPNLFGILGPAPTYNVNAAGHVLHAALAVVSLGVGFIAQGGRQRIATTR